jgi:hypothetical protein
MIELSILQLLGIWKHLFFTLIRERVNTLLKHFMN